VSGVRCPCVPASAVSDGNEVAGYGSGAGSRTAGMAGVGMVARDVHYGGSSARGWSLALEAGAGRAGPAEGRLGRRRGRWLAVGQVDRERGWMRARIARRGSWRWPRCVVIVWGLGPGRLASEPLGCTLTWACGRSAAASVHRASPARGWRRS